MIFNKLFLCLLATVFAMGTSSNLYAKSFNPLVSKEVTEECKTFIASLDQLGYRHGWVETPLDASEPLDQTVNVFWYTRDITNRVPIIFFYGGPIYDDRSSYKDFKPFEDKYGINFVYMDQRGMGCSSKPLPIKDEATADVASYFGSENMVKDAEEIRKQYLGPNKKWKAFGQSFGGEIVSRYVSMFPQSLSAAYSFAGMPQKEFSEFFYERLKSNIRQVENYFKKYPQDESLMNAFIALFDDSKCWAAIDIKMCGKQIHHFIMEIEMFSPFSWDKVHELISKPQCKDDCVFNLDGSLSQNFFQKYYTANEWGFSYVSDKRQRLLVDALLKQQTMMVSPSGMIDLDLEKALEKLKREGIDTGKMIWNHSVVLKMMYPDDYVAEFNKTVAKTPVRNVLTPEKLAWGLKSEPGLKFYSYTGGFDGGDTNSTISTELSRQFPNQFIYTHFPESDHWGYFDQEKVWQDLVLEPN